LRVNLPTIVLKGTVFSGTGEGKNFVSLPWVQQQIKEKLGFSPYAGTLNLHLNWKNAEKKALLGTAGAMWIEPQAGYCPGVMYKAEISDLECAIVVPKVADYPADVLEVIAPVCLRTRLKLVDGGVVVVSVNV
jgi:riboflavin kinase, archaea type